MSKIEVDAIEPQSGTSLTIGASGDTVTVPSGVTFDASNATTTLPSNVVTTTGTQTLTNKTIDASQLTDSTISLAKLSATGTKDATTFLRGDNTFAEAGGGKVLQVVQTVKTDTSSIASTLTWTDFGLSAIITPSSTSSKVLAIASMSIGGTPGGRGGVKIQRGSTDILLADTDGSRTRTSLGHRIQDSSDHYSKVIVYLDSPSTTSATTYKIQGITNDVANTIYLNRAGGNADSDTQFRGTSTLTLIEIGS